MFNGFIKNRNNIKKGFSLVEMLIVFAIMMIMIAMLLSKNNSAKSDTEAAAQQIAAQLRSLQNSALTGMQATNDAGTITSSVCTFEFDGTAKTSYVAKYYRECSFLPVTEAFKTLSIVTLHNVEINAGRMTFQSPHGNVGGAATISIKSKKDSSSCSEVILGAGGNIEIKKNTCP